MGGGNSVEHGDEGDGDLVPRRTEAFRDAIAVRQGGNAVPKRS